MLEIRYLLTELEHMGRAIADHTRLTADRLGDAERALARFALVDDALRDKVQKAADVDLSWRGALPLSPRLDQAISPSTPPLDATLIGVDGSQIYLDPHGMTPYYLVNTGAIILRQGSGEAPDTRTRPHLFYRQADLYQEDGQLIDNQHVNAMRDDLEMGELVTLATSEATSHPDRRLLAMVDGPLLIWVRHAAGQEREEFRRIMNHIHRLAETQRLGVIPVGYVDRPRSANVMRTLHIAQMELEEIDQERVRVNPYQTSTDRALFARLLGPNQRSAVFVSTTQLNFPSNHAKRGNLSGLFANQGQQIAFFYLNIARKPGRDQAHIVRVEVPVWVTETPGHLDEVQQAIYQDCEGIHYPYVLIRAHELAVVTHKERLDFEDTLRAVMLREGLLPEISTKAMLKQSF